VIAAVCIVLNSITASAAVAQTRPGWSEPQPISLPTEHGSSPTLAVDSRGVVHAFWSTKPVDAEGAPWAIAYARLENGLWSQPIDIFLSPGNRDALFPRALVDDAGRLHLVWSAPGQGTFGPLYHSWAPVDQAGSLQAWQPPVELASGTYQSDLRLAADGTLHLVYASVMDGAGICHRASSNQGDSWSEPTCIERSYVLRDDEHEVRPRLAIDSQNTLHAVWMLDDSSPGSLLAYSGRAVYYARSETGGLDWSSPMVVDEIDGRGTYDRQIDGLQPEWGNIVVDGSDRVHIVWVGRPDMQRYHQWSEDGGETWTPRQVVIPSGGYNNWQGIAVDGDGAVHLVWPSLNGLEYTTWSEGSWSPVVPVAEQRLVGAAHHAQAVVALGNQLHVVWQDHGGNLDSSKPGRILHASLGTAAEAEPPVPLPVVVAMSEPAPAGPTVAPTPIPEPTVTNLRSPVMSNEQPTASTSTGVILAFSVLPVLLIVAGVLLWRVRSR